MTTPNATTEKIILECAEDLNATYCVQIQDCTHGETKYYTPEISHIADTIRPFFEKAIIGTDKAPENQSEVDLKFCQNLLGQAIKEITRLKSQNADLHYTIERINSAITGDGWSFEEIKSLVKSYCQESLKSTSGGSEG